MRKLLFPTAMLCLAGLAGCATMSQKDCQNADWRAIGYNDGARGKAVGQLNTYDQRCAEYKITPDAGAYQTGWGQGIRTYCTSANGYNAGTMGLPYRNVCPPDVAPTFLSGYQQGLNQYCAPGHALQLGLSGHPYYGVCPADMAPVFMQRYRLGRDLHRARDRHEDIERRLSDLRRDLPETRDDKLYHERLEHLSHLRHADADSEAMLAGLNACASGDWFGAGLSDGEDGQPFRAGDLARLCGDYGAGADPGGYRDGWQRGNAHYCSFDSGLYAGQAGLAYQDVCNGPGYMRFWGGYIQGLASFHAGRYAGHARPRYRQERRRAPPPRPQPRHEPRHTHHAHAAPRPVAHARPVQAIPHAQATPVARTPAHAADPTPAQKRKHHRRPRHPRRHHSED